MKPTVVQFPQGLSLAGSEVARVAARHGVTAYAMSLVLAATALVTSFFYKEITHTFGYTALGVRVGSFWHALFLAGAVAWFCATILGLLCVPQRGRVRAFGLSSLGMNLAAAMLLACTML